MSMDKEIIKEIIKEMRQAIKGGDLIAVKNLLDRYDGLLHVVTTFGTWLHDASTYGQYEVAKYLIECGIDVNINGGVSDCSAITSAAFEGNKDIVELLFLKGAQLDVSSLARNPLFAAIYNGHYEVAKYLIDNGIDITAKYAIGQLDNVDAYEYARQYGQTEIANYLKEKMESQV